MDLQNPLELTAVKAKLAVIETACHEALLGQSFFVPARIGRDIETVPIKKLPSKNGFASLLGQARLLHDLANIELQAMEMGFRTLVEYQGVAEAFRRQLVDVVLDEARHLSLCLRELGELGFQWGDWPVHTTLWDCLSQQDTLLDRVVIVHRYLEGSGLDASEKIQRRLVGVADKGVIEVVKTIANDEVGHVLFGSNWYKKICQSQNLDPDLDFQQRVLKLQDRLPRRLESINHQLRRKAGFSSSEIKILEQLQHCKVKS